MPQTEPYLLKGLSKKELISTLYNNYGKKLYSYGIKTWNLNEDESWELVYKTLYNVVEKLKNTSFASEEKFASYLFKTFLNLIRNHYRDNKKEKELFNNTASIDELKTEPKELTAQVQKQSIQMTILNEELEKMEDWQRMLLLMRSEGMPYSEIAKFIDKPTNQLKVYYQRLKENISKRIHERL